MAEEHPFAPRLEHAFTISIELSAPYWVTPSVRGETRAAIYAKSGTVEGPRLTGKVIPMSGGDFPLSRESGVIDFDARYLIEASDGAIIYLENRGYRWARDEGISEKLRNNQAVSFDDYYMRVTPKFDAPAGPHEWMSKHVFVGVAEKIPGANRIHYFVVL